MPREITRATRRERRPIRQTPAPRVAQPPVPHELSDVLLDLQRTIGNQAVNQLLRGHPQQRAACMPHDAPTRDYPLAHGAGLGDAAHADTLPPIQRAPAEAKEGEVAAATPLWEEVNGACTSLAKEIAIHKTPNSNWGERLTEIWGQVGGPGEKSDADLKRVRNDLDDLKIQIAEEYKMARESWKVDDAYYQEERKALESGREDWSKDAIRILGHQYEDTAHIVQTAGDYLTLDDLVPLEFMLKENKHRQYAKTRAERLKGGATTPAETPGSDDGGEPSPGDLALPGGMEATNEAALRELYMQGSRAIRDEARLMVAKGADAAEVADWAVAARNNLKARIRNRGLRITKVLAEARNKRKYGDPLGKSAEQMRQEGKTNEQIIEKVAETSPKATKWAGRLRIAGRITIAVDIGLSVYRIATVPAVDRPRVLLEEAGRLAGAVAGAEVGAEGGAEVGAGVGEWFGPEGAAVGGVVGGIIGGIAGGIGGAWGGRKLAGFVANELYPPVETGFEGDYEAESETSR